MSEVSGADIIDFRPRGRSALISIAGHIDSLIDSVIRFGFGRQLELAPGESDLFAVTFHKIFSDAEHVRRAGCYPHESVTVADLEFIIEWIKASGRTFVTPRDILAGRHIGRRCALLTFDDGYADNARLPPLLERSDACGTFFVSIAHIECGSRFWADAIFVEARRRGWDRGRMLALLRDIEASTHPAAAEKLRDVFGPRCLYPEGDDDRPMTPDELARLAQSPRVEIGSHSAEHVALAGRPEDYIVQQIQRSQSAIERLTGSAPIAIAYPNGRYDARVMAACRREGLAIGFMTEFRRQRLGKWDGSDRFMQVGRCTLSGTHNLKRQLVAAELPVSALRLLHRMKGLQIKLALGSRSSAAGS